MRFTQQQLEYAKQVSIVKYLASKGIFPIDKEAADWLYFSPLREDKNPSFYVNETKNGFKDFAREEHKGDSISLVMMLEQIDFVSAVKKLLVFQAEEIGDLPILSFSAAQNSVKKRIDILYERPLSLTYLIDYTLSRKIPLELAKYYLKEVKYVIKEQKYSALGFKNDAGGYELRNAHFKGSSLPKDITTFHVPQSTKVAVFEGFFDFLSALVWFGIKTPRISTVVLNSTSNRTKATHYLSQFEQVNCFFDRDAAGTLCFDLMKNKDGLNVKSCAAIYDNYKDFNELLNQT